jgi:RNA polymerase sigma-70 factor (ECF subfamily)
MNAMAVAPAHDLDELYHQHHRIIWGLCYRMTGCAADADDIVQETFARAIERAQSSESMAWRPWLMRVATNLSLDVLRQRKRRTYPGPWLPSPVDATDDTAPVEAPFASAEARYEWRESLTFAFLLTIEALTPRQRAVLLLRDVFDHSARETADLLGLSEANVRITHLRARRAMENYDRSWTRLSGATVQKSELLQRFIMCLVTHDAEGAASLLSESVRTLTDGGGEYTALRRPLVGRRAVLTLHLRVAMRRGAGARVEWRTLNGEPGVLIQYASAVRRQAPRAVVRCEVGEDGRICELHTVMASRKLTAVRF